MNIEENQNENSLLAGQDPHQREEMDQATAASAASFTLEPEKGITADPKEFNKGGDQGNIKQADAADYEQADFSGGEGFDQVSEIDLDADENAVTDEDLQALGGPDENSDEEESTM